MPIIRTKDGRTYELIGYSAFTGRLRVRCLEHGYEKTIFKEAVEPRSRQPLAIKE